MVTLDDIIHTTPIFTVNPIVVSAHTTVPAPSSDISDITAVGWVRVGITYPIL